MSLQLTAELGDPYLEVHLMAIQGQPPVHVLSWRITEHTSTAIDDELNAMLKHCFFRLSKSPYVSLIIIITKKDDGMQFSH